MLLQVNFLSQLLYFPTPVGPHTGPIYLPGSLRQAGSTRHREQFLFPHCLAGPRHPLWYMTQNHPHLPQSLDTWGSGPCGKGNRASGKPPGLLRSPLNNPSSYVFLGRVCQAGPRALGPQRPFQQGPVSGPPFFRGCHCVSNRCTHPGVSKAGLLFLSCDPSVPLPGSVRAVEQGSVAPLNQWETLGMGRDAGPAPAGVSGQGSTPLRQRGRLSPRLGPVGLGQSCVVSMAKGAGQPQDGRAESLSPCP